MTRRCAEAAIVVKTVEDKIEEAFSWQRIGLPE